MINIPKFKQFYLENFTGVQKTPAKKVFEQQENVKYITREEYQKILEDAKLDMQRVVAMVYAKYPFFGFLLSRLVVKPTNNPNRYRTMATDGSSIVYSPFFVREHTYPELEWVVCHEILHCALGHFSRMQNREPEKWNYATDYAINLLLDAVGKPVEGALYDKKWSGMAAEVIYDQLPADAGQQGQKGGPPQQGGKGQGDPQQGQGGGQPGQPGQDQGEGEGGGQGEPKDGQEGEGQGQGGKPGEYKPNQGQGQGQGGAGEGDDFKIRKPEPGEKGMSPGEVHAPGTFGEVGKTAEQLEKEFKDAVQAAASRFPGSVPGGLVDMVNPKYHHTVSWKKELRKYVNALSQKVKYSLPNRRFVGSDKYLYGMKKDYSLDQMIIAVDTSGSVSTEALGLFLGEINKIIKETDISELRLLDVDTKIHEDRIIKKPKQLPKIDFKGRGGTAFEPVMKYVDKYGKNGAVVIYFTDGYANFPDAPSNQKRWIWFIVNANGDVEAPWGKTIKFISNM